jgi:inorganic pyrophosphatase
MTQLALTNPIIIDRPKGTPHPRYAEVFYPLDYGYLENTRSSGGDGIDIWLGVLNTNQTRAEFEILTGILCTFDTLKRVAEIKLLIGCTSEEMEIILNFHSEMHTLFIPNPKAKNEFP